jgi:hypothetical protein
VVFTISLFVLCSATRPFRVCVFRTVPLAHALGAHSVVAARESLEETLQDLDETGPYQVCT